MSSLISCITANLSLGAINIPKHNKISVIESNLTPPQRMGDKERESGKRFVDVDGVKMDIAEYLNYKAG